MGLGEGSMGRRGIREQMTERRDQTAEVSAAPGGRYAPELVFAVVAPSGIDFGQVRRAIAEQMSGYGYELLDVRISDWLRVHSGLGASDLERPDIRIPRLQQVGDDVRRLSRRPEALAYVVIREIAASRKERNSQAGAVEGSEDEDKPLKATAFLVWSLKHKKEAEVLRQVYGSHFFLLSVYAPAESREERLAALMADKSASNGRARKFLGKARQVIEVDEDEPLAGDFGQNVRDAYPLADFFLDGSNDVDLRATTERAIHVVFGYPFATPTKDEFAMYVADAAGLRSAEPGRQVGAVIASDNGDVIAIGTNDVPVFGGGHFWADSYHLLKSDDNREYRNEVDTSDKTKRQLAREIVVALREAGVVSSKELSDDELYASLERTGLRELTEYGRAVHGELSALMDAARRGVPVEGHTMYVTTFPCHNCSRHVVAAGIRRLVYIYPYAKSRASDLHGDSIQTTFLSRLDKKKVHFQPFLGIAPRRYPTAFAMPRRKDEKTGRIEAAFDPLRSPRLPDEGPDGRWDVAAHIDREKLAILDIGGWLPDVVDELKKKYRDQEGQDAIA
jgi:cytidine deaminase